MYLFLQMANGQAVESGSVADATSDVLYIVKAGDSLKLTLINWSIKNNFIVKWEVQNELDEEIDFILPADITFGTNYYDAVELLFKSYNMNSADIGGSFEYNFYKNGVLHVALKFR